MNSRQRVEILFLLLLSFYTVGRLLLNDQTTKIMNKEEYTGLEIAVIGMACKFPGANDVDQFWENLKNGVESVSTFSEEELREYAIPEEDLSNSSYVKNKGDYRGRRIFRFRVFWFFA